MKIKDIPLARHRDGDVHYHQPLSGLRVSVASIRGRRDNQQDRFFTAAAPARSIAETEEVLRHTFDRLRTLCPPANRRRAGTTATIAVLSSGDKLTVAHIGDSPLYLFTRDRTTGDVEAHQMIAPHAPDALKESERVVSDGGEIFDLFPGTFDPCPRVRGNNGVGYLAMTRHLGEKIPGVSDREEITSIDLTPYRQAGKQLFLCLSSDGLYPAGHPIKPEEYAAIIQSACRQYSPKNLAQTMVDYAYWKGGTDNISVLFTEIPRMRRAQDAVLAMFDGHGGHQLAEAACGEARHLLGCAAAQDHGASHYR